VVIDAGWLGSPAFAKKKKGQNTEVPSENNFTKGVAQFKSHDWDGAIDSFLQAIYFARNGYNPEAYFWLGKSYMAHHEDAKAIEALNKHIEQNMGGSPDGHYYLGEIYLRNDRLKEAELEASKSQTEFFGKGEKAHNLHGKILAAKGDYGSAQWEFQRALGDQPWKYTDAWQNYAETYMKQKNWAQAFKQYSAIIAAANRLEDVDLQKCYLNVGLCELAKGNHQGAIDNYHQVLEINSNNADAHLNLGMVFDSESHFSSAVKEYSEFVRCSTDEKKVQKAKERITMLEQKIRPPDDPVVKPSLYMRMHPDAPGAGGAGGQQPPQKPKPPADSGF
jgi:tetratricopeptide (TPR) repeat protein